MPEQAINLVAAACAILGLLALYILSGRLENIIRERYPNQWEGVMGTPMANGISMSRRPLLLFSVRKPVMQLEDPELRRLVRLSDVALLAVLVPFLYVLLIAT